MIIISPLVAGLATGGLNAGMGIFGAFSQRQAQEQEDARDEALRVAVVERRAGRGRALRDEGGGDHGDDHPVLLQVPAEGHGFTGGSVVSDRDGRSVAVGACSLGSFQFDLVRRPQCCRGCARAGSMR